MNRRITVLQTGALPLGYVTTNGRALEGSTYINKVPLFLPRSLHEAFRVALAQNFDYGIKRARVNSYPSFFWSGLRGSNPPPRPWQGRALPNELNPHRWCLRSESNQRHGDFQSPALPTELQRHTARAAVFFLVATRRGLEPLTSSVTG